MSGRDGENSEAEDGKVCALIKPGAQLGQINQAPDRTFGADKETDAMSALTYISDNTDMELLAELYDEQVDDYCDPMEYEDHLGDCDPAEVAMDLTRECMTEDQRLLDDLLTRDEDETVAHILRQYTEAMLLDLVHPYDAESEMPCGITAGELSERLGGVSGVEEFLKSTDWERLAAEYDWPEGCEDPWV